MQRKLALSSSAIALVLCTRMASADVTGAEIWADWQSSLNDFGYEMTGTQSQSDDRLTISDAAMTFTMPEVDGKVSVAIGTLAFIDNADGTVSVIYPEDMPMTFDLSPPEGEAVKGRVIFTHTAPQMVVSGQADDLIYTYASKTVGLELDNLEVDGNILSREMLSMGMEAENVAFATRITKDDMRRYSQDFTADKMQYKVAFSEPEANSAGSFQGQINNMDLQGTGVIPGGAEDGDLSTLIAAGLDARSEYTFTDGANVFSVQSPEGNVLFKSTAAVGNMAVTMGAAGLGYDWESVDINMDMQVPGFPLPVALSVAKSAANFTLPIKPGLEEQDFAFGVALEDFTLSDAIWGLFDPAGQLPRDPATILVDLAGTAKIIMDIFDQADSERVQRGESMGELNTLAINSLVLDAVGAVISGEGSFTFDNTDTDTFDGIARPEGALDLRVEGLNALIDTLVNMGILPSEQALGARMMMGLFTVPGGEDVLTSKIEINAEGRILANGQMIR